MHFRTDGIVINEDTPVSLADMVGHYKRSKFLAEREAIKAAQAGQQVAGHQVDRIGLHGGEVGRGVTVGLRQQRADASRPPVAEGVVAHENRKTRRPDRLIAVDQASAGG